MLGWEIFIQRRAGGSGGPRGQTLATWRAGLGGLDWIDNLATRGRAEALGGNGYPDSYRVTAGVLADVLENGVPRHTGPDVIGDDYLMPGGFIGDVFIDLGLIRSLPSDEILDIDAWDQS